jgi:hypothetical protein
MEELKVKCNFGVKIEPSLKDRLMLIGQALFSKVITIEFANGIDIPLELIDEIKIPKEEKKKKVKILHYKAVPNKDGKSFHYKKVKANEN